MMLDAKRTFDELVERRAPDAKTRDAVLSNRIYQELSNAVAGSQEYMAMEKLYELHDDGRYDLLVLDTPPTRNALDFLDAPERLSPLHRLAVAPVLPRARAGAGCDSSGRGTGLLFGALKRVTGIDLLQDLSDFFASFGDMAEGFNAAREPRQRAARRRAAATSCSSRAPQSDSIEEAHLLPRPPARRRGCRSAARS